MLRVFILLTVICLAASLEVVTNDHENATVGDSNVILFCAYEGVPEGASSLTVEWKYVGAELTKTLARKAVDRGIPTFDDARYDFEDGGVSLQILNLTTEDDGEYSCNVMYVHDGSIVKASSTTRLVVIGPEMPTTHAHTTDQPFEIEISYSEPTVVKTGKATTEPSKVVTEPHSGPTAKMTKMAVTKLKPTDSNAKTTETTGGKPTHKQPAEGKQTDRNTASILRGGQFSIYIFLAVFLLQQVLN